MTEQLEKEKLLAARRAVEQISDGQTVGLGTGSTAAYAVREIGEKVRRGLQIRGVPTSEATAQLARSLGITVVGVDQVDRIDITIDGADEFDAHLNLIKGGGGALFMEKIVARLSAREIIIADSSKQVERLGKFKVPIEVVPIAERFAQRQIEILGGGAAVRERDGAVFATDAGNRILDADFGLIEDLPALSDGLDRIEGVVCHGLFLGLAHEIIVARGAEIHVLTGR